MIKKQTYNNNYSNLLSIFKFKLFLLSLIVLTFSSLTLISSSFAQTCQGDDCLSEEDFVSDPRNAFRNSANEAWSYVMRNPIGVYNGLNGESIIRESYRSSPENFVNVVTQNTQLLENPTVRELFEQQVERDINILNQNPTARRDFLRQYGVADVSAHLQSFNRRRGEITTVGLDGQERVRIPLSVMNGGRINSDGSVTLQDGIQILSGQAQIRNSELRLRRGGVLRVPNHDGFISSSSMLGITSNLETRSFELSGRNIELRDSNNIILNRIRGVYTLFPDNQAILGGRSRIEYLNSQGQVLEDVRVSQQTLIRNSRGCEGTQMSCIYRSGGSVEINARGNNRINYDYNYEPDVDFTVLPVVDNSRVVVNVPTDSRNAQFTIGQTTGVRGSLGHNSNFNLAYSHFNGDGFVEMTDYVIRNNRFYSMYTGDEMPQHALALECRVGESCGRHGLTQTTYGTFCDSRNVCRNSHGVRVDRTGSYFMNSNGHIIGQVGRDRLNPYLLDRDSRGIWIEGVGYEFTPSTRGRAARRDDMFEGRIPEFSSDVVPPNFCARYVRLAGERLFGTNFAAANAWDMHRHHQTTFRFDDQRRRAGSISQQELNHFTGQARNAFQSGQISQGTAIRFWNPGSRWRGNDVTHVALVLGTNAQGEVLIGHQYGSRYYQETLPQMMARTNNRPRDILVS